MFFLLQQVDSFEFNLKDANFESLYNIKPLTEVSPKHFNLVFQSKELTKYLFPMDRIVISWLPFKPLTSNIPLFWHKEVMFTDMKLISTHCKSNGSGGLLTSFSFFPVSFEQYVLNIDIFGTDTSTIDRHVLAHLATFKRTIQTGTICLYICSEEGMVIKEQVTDLLRRNGIHLLKKSKQASQMNRMNVIEINITENETKNNLEPVDIKGN